MSGISLSVALQAAILVTGAQNYEEAYEKAKTEGKPFMVLVGADW